MMKKITYILCALTLALASCSDDSNTNRPEPGPYASGIIYYGTSAEDLAFYDPATRQYSAGNIFSKVNRQTVGADGWTGGINDVCIYKGKAYFLTPNTSETGENAGKARIAVADAETFKLQKAVYADGFDMATLGNIYNMAVVNENKFYVTYNSASNISGIRVLKVNPISGDATLSGDIEGAAGAIGVDGPVTFQRMLRHANWVVAPCGSKIQFINTGTDRVDAAKTIQKDARRHVTDIVKGRDGYIYALVAGKQDKGQDWLWGAGATGPESDCSVVKINPSTMREMEEVFMQMDQNDPEYVEDTPLRMRSSMESNGAVASLTTDEILFNVGKPYKPTQVYAYNFKTKQTRFVFKTPEMSVSKYMAADKAGNVYVPQVPEHFKGVLVSVFGIADGVRNTDIEADFTAIDPWELPAPASNFWGDGGFIATYSL